MQTQIRFTRLFDLAKELSQNAASQTSPAQCEVMRRAAVGRAYYAVFLVGRNKFGIGATSGVHAMVQSAVSAKDPLLGLEYANLRLLREIADYQFPPIDPTKGDWEANWISAEDLAESLLSELPKLV